ncbi:unnamed protein product [Mesocestoides corti]|uniref:Uncharacterized protein n=1 Tax=Mesocestoides corti TaxID=53468 RepID=A0A0R3U7C7_MESCO|nr:unnamed protein product [Mesocestoides corti]
MREQLFCGRFNSSVAPCTTPSRSRRVLTDIYALSLSNTLGYPKYRSRIVGRHHDDTAVYSMTQTPCVLCLSKYDVLNAHELKETAKGITIVTTLRVKTQQLRVDFNGVH